MQFKELKFSGVDFPVPLSQITKVEQLNGLAINVFRYPEDAGVHPSLSNKRPHSRSDQPTPDY